MDRETIKQIIIKAHSLNYPEVKTMGDIAGIAADQIILLIPKSSENTRKEVKR